MAGAVVSIVSVLLLVVALRATPAASAVARFGAFDNAALLFPDTNVAAAAAAAAAGAGVAPRWYMEQGTPAQPAKRLSPRNPWWHHHRHLLPLLLGGRQDDDDGGGVCAAGQHSCVEANAGGFCCRNDQYCYLDASWQTKCCSLGVKCPGSPCDADQLYCNITSTTITPLVTRTTATLITTAPAATTTTQEEQRTATLTSVAVYSTLAACCGRACGESSFSCEQSFGGQCCPYGFKCALAGKCIADPVPSTSSSSSVSTIVSAVPPGCTTSQISCAASDGGGCCDIGSTCTFQGMSSATATAVCAPDLTLADGGGSSLSDGARVGIGVGVAVGAAIVIGAVTWLCIRRRRRRGRHAGGTASNPSANEMRQNTMGVDGGGGGGGGGRQTPGGSGYAGESLVPGPQTPFTPYSETSGPTSASRRGHSYFGPDAMVGPYTEREGDGPAAYDTRLLATTPPSAPLDHDPTQGPWSPEHVVMAAELGGIEKTRINDNDNERDGDDKEHDRLLRKGAGSGSTGQKDDDDDAADYKAETIEGRFELMGSPCPSPLSPDEGARPMGHGPLSPSWGEGGDPK